MRRDLFSIGEFSRMSGLTVKALRLYDEQEILRPGFTDNKSGYRYYSSAQLAEANLIRKLRSLELAIEDIRRYLRLGSLDERNALLDEHRRKMKEKLDSYSSIVDSLEKLAKHEEPVTVAEVEVKEISDQPVLSVKFTATLREIGDSLGKAYGDIFKYMGVTGIAPDGPPVAVYYDMEIKEEDMKVEACIPVGETYPGDEAVSGRLLPGCRAASFMHIGCYEGFYDAYQSLFIGISNKGLKPVGPLREVYLIGPDSVKDPNDYRTEILCPVEGPE